MDPRAVGKWDMLRISTVEDAIWAFDEAEAGSEGRVSVDDFKNQSQTMSHRQQIDSYK
jgi:hypothetical protein